MNFNKVIVLGNLTRDPESRTLPSGQSVVSFSIATNRFYTDKSGQKQKAAEFHNIVAFGRLAEICSRYLSKGKLALVEGRLQTRSWQGQDGSKRWRTEIVMENMQLGPRGVAGDSPTGPSDTPSQAEEIPIIDADEDFAADNKDGVNVDEIPF
ncbi:MAG: single-stranded DNA-binding protein [Candidatus Portnoybacteria bacterium]|jgi:single-strand DNA-binding protein|nr:single-stranded DNA-binding protein [Candidatus Portnoybacteria bacterium]